ncbi:hypothetical protein [Anaplasma phagocytophilum]|nr:hypothetical protein [Anaplasma phagocytophilum]
MVFKSQKRYIGMMQKFSTENNNCGYSTERTSFKESNVIEGESTCIAV